MTVFSVYLLSSLLILVFVFLISVLVEGFRMSLVEREAILGLR